MVRRWAVVEGGLELNDNGGWVNHSDYLEIESKLDLMTIQADHWHEQNVELESRLNSCESLLRRVLYWHVQVEGGGQLPQDISRDLHTVFVVERQS